MSKKNKSFVRFVIVADDGRTSGSYKVWTEKNEIYLLERITGSSFKVSLHKSGNWQISFTSEFISDKNMPNKNRHIKKWDAPLNNIGNGTTLAFRIRIPESELREPCINNNKNLEYIKAPEKWHYIEVDLILTENNTTFPEDWPGKNKMKTSLLKEMKLLNGNSLWIVYWYSLMNNRQLIELNQYKNDGQKIIKKMDTKQPKMILMGHENDGSRQFIEVSLT